MKYYWTIILLGVISLNTAFAQELEEVPVTDFGKMYLPVWQEAREHCLAVARAMPEEKYAWKPTDVSKTFAEQMVHIGYTIKLLTQRYVEGMEVVANTPSAMGLSKAEIISMLEEGFEYTEKVVFSITEDRLRETCKMYHSGNIVSRKFAFFYVQDHLTNHRAKANLYIRMNGIQPPEYTW